MKTLKTILFLASIALGFIVASCREAKAQTNTTIGQDLSDAIQKIASSSNMLWESHFTYASALQKKQGAGIGGYYLLTDTGGTNISLSTYTGVRVDWVDGGFWMPQGNVGIQTPIRIASWLQVSPFTYAGIGVPLSGATVGGITLGTAPRDNGGQATAILGAGLAVKLFSFSSNKYDVGFLGDSEKWSGFSGSQYRLGAWFRRNF